MENSNLQYDIELMNVASKEIVEAWEAFQKALLKAQEEIMNVFTTVIESTKQFFTFIRSYRPRGRQMNKTGRNREERQRDQVKLRGQRRNRRK